MAIWKLLLLLLAQTVAPTGKTITPDAAPGASFQQLSAGQAMSTALSPDGRTLLVLTSGYSINVESVLVYEFAIRLPQAPGVDGRRRNQARLVQTLTVPAACGGIAWNPSGKEFYTGGGDGDNVLVFARQASGAWARSATIALGHKAGLGTGNYAIAAGVAVNAAGTLPAVANFENDSLSVIDVAARRVTGEVDLRPGGGYPFWVAIQGNAKAYVSSVRDREIVTVDLTARTVTGGTR